jgi:hypothetical protein
VGMVYRCKVNHYQGQMVGAGHSQGQAKWDGIQWHDARSDVSDVTYAKLNGQRLTDRLVFNEINFRFISEFQIHNG